MSPQLLVNMAVIIEYTIRGEEGKRSLSLSLRFFVSQCFLSFTHRIIYRRPSAFLSLNQSIHVEINTVVNDFHQDFLNDSIWRSETKQRSSKLMLDRRRGCCTIETMTRKQTARISLISPATWNPFGESQTPLCTHMERIPV